MTGYGKGVAENKNLFVEVEIKTVNSRYLDIFLRTPNSLMSKEYEIRELIKSKIKRGKLTVIVQLQKNEQAVSDSLIDKDKLKGFISLLKQIKKEAKLTEKIKLEHILYNREIFTLNNSEFSEEDFELVKKSLNDAIGSLIKMKKNEGKELEIDLKKRLEIIEEKLDLIEAESRNGVNEYFEKYKERVKSLVENIMDYNDRLEAELAMLAERSDITEECVRLKSHIKFFHESMKNDDEPGRRLNFLCQEMNRETNTISSKSVSTGITHNSVFIKEEIEKLREQIQNIE